MKARLFMPIAVAIALLLGLAAREPMPPTRSRRSPPSAFSATW